MSKKRRRNHKAGSNPRTGPGRSRRDALMRIAIPASLNSALPLRSIEVLRSYAEKLLTKPTEQLTADTAARRAEEFAAGKVRELWNQCSDVMDSPALMPFFSIGMGENGIAVQAGEDAIENFVTGMFAVTAFGLREVCCVMEERLRTLDGDLTELGMSAEAAETYRAMFGEYSLTMADLVDTAQKLEQLQNAATTHASTEQATVNV